jgi:hypothetical protein
MLKVYNKQALTRNQRFQKALLYGGAATIVSIVAYVFIASILPFESSLLYIGFGYGIGYVIRTYGKGVQPRFSILGAVLAVLCFLIGDAVMRAGWLVLVNPVALIQVVLFNVSALIGTGLSGLLGLAFRLAGVYFAYTESRIV